MNRLVVTADDFGLAPEVNEAIEIAHRRGILTSASLMVGGPAAADAIARARRLPSLHVGLHVALTDVRPVLPSDQVSGLIGDDGRFRADMIPLAFAVALRPSVRRQMAAEIAAQFAAFRATQLPFDHVDVHRHFHLHPLIGAEVIALARKFAVPAIRVPAEPRSVLAGVEPRSGGSSPLLAAWTALLRRRAKQAGLTTADATFGLAWSGAMTQPRIAGLLRRLPQGLVEIYTHPAMSDDFAGHAAGYRYVEELSALTDAEVVMATQRCGHTSGGFSG